MYLRPCYRRKEGKRHAYWALVESDRTARGPRQRVVSWLGAMDDRGRLAVKRCAQREAAVQSELFTETAPEWVEVDRKRVCVERSRHFGGCWLGLELVRRLELSRCTKIVDSASGEQFVSLKSWTETELWHVNRGQNLGGLEGCMLRR